MPVIGPQHIVARMRTPGRFIASARLIAVLTLCSRVLGLIRESVLAYFFSTNEILSAFRIAFMAPNLARRLFGEGALSSAMIPVLTESLQIRGEEASRRFVGALLALLAVVLVLGVIAAEAAIAVWRTASDDIALQLAAILMPYMALICTVAVASGVLNARGHFATPAAVPMILNGSMILAALAGATWWGLSGLELIHVLCIAVLVGGVAQIIATAIALRAVAFFPIFSFRWRDPQLRAVGALMLPIVLGLSAVQINSLVDYVIAYLFVRADGERVGPAVLGFAQYLYQLPLGVFGIAVATAIFPVLSRAAAKGDRAGLAAVLAHGIGLSLFIALPSTVGLLFVSQPLVATIFERGTFDAASTERVAGTLFFYSLGIVAYFVHHLLARTFYALRNSRTPARIAMSMVGVNLVMNLSLVGPMEERGLALATAVCAAIQVVWLAVALRRVLPELVWGDVMSGAVRMLIATAIMALVLAMLGQVPLPESPLGGHRGVRLAVMVVGGVVSYGAAARLLRIAELGALLRRRQTSEPGSADGESKRGV